MKAPSMTASDFDSCRSGVRAWSIGAIAILLGLTFALLPAPNASAETTHPLLGHITLPAGSEDVQPMGVDAEGNLLVWLNEQRAIGKFDPGGNPVNFPALGTNLIDGAGGFNCPSTPADCDRVPTNGFLQKWILDAPNVAIDHSGGPADGYIYMVNNHQPQPSEVDVFDKGGKFLGKIDQAQAGPRGGLATEPKYGISVDSDGVLYILKGETAFSGVVDRYVPIDSNPAHDEFSGQLRANNMTMNTIAAGPTYVYTGGRAPSGQGDMTHLPKGADPSRSPYYEKFPQSQLHLPGISEEGESIDFSPDIGPFGDGGANPPTGTEMPIIGIDPADEHVYIGNGWAGFEEFDAENHKIGPTFGNKGCPGNAPFPPLDPSCSIGDYTSLHSIAFDRSGGLTDGRIYVHGRTPNEISVFGPPVVIPDIEYGPETLGHSSVEISGLVSLAGGPAVTGCRVDWGGLDYGHTVPCTPAAPYGASTSVGAEISGLEVEHQYHYRLVVENANGENAGVDRVFAPHAVLDVETGAATKLTPSTATLNGLLNPDGMATEYHFEYGIGTNYPESTPTSSAPSGSSAVSLPASEIVNLQRGRIYHYRLVASNALGVTHGEDRTFVSPSAPAISSLYTSGVTETTAQVHARINPFGSDTEYQIEYGLNPSYGSVTPMAIVGSGNAATPVSTELALERGQTYHFRIVATNVWGTSRSSDSTISFQSPDCPNSHIRQQTNSSYLPDCRAYELVSPGDAGAGQVFPGDVPLELGKEFGFQGLGRFLAPNTGLAISPSRFGFFGGQGAIKGLNPPNTMIDRYVSTRTNEGWITTFPGTPASEVFGAQDPQCDRQMNKCIDFRLNDPFYNSVVGGEGEPTSSRAPYVRDVEEHNLGRWPTNMAEVPGSDQYIGAYQPSADFSHFAFSSRNVAFTEDGLTAAPGSAYDNDTEARTLTMISKLPGGGAIPMEPSNIGDSTEYIRFPAVSADGSHILMSTSSAPVVCPNFFETLCAAPYPVHLYLRVNDAITYDVSGGVTVDFVGMTDSGSEVDFVTATQLAPADTDFSMDLYQWSEATGQIAILSQGNGKGNTDACSASWTTACGIRPLRTDRPDTDNVVARDSGDVYFYSPEQLDPTNPGVRNEMNLYVYRENSVQYVTSLESGKPIDRIQVSPSGARAAFLTRSNLGSYDSEGSEEMYTFQVERGEVKCASCLPNGEPPEISYDDPRGDHTGTLKDVMASKSGPFMSNDGRVAFTTADALVPADTNSNLDVYEFAGDMPRLITTGTGNRFQLSPAVLFPGLDTGFESISSDGVDLYFSTFETLVPQDRNGSFVKLYDARTSGGFELDPPALPCTAADECHGDSSSAPAPAQNGTGAHLGGGGNHKARHKRRRKARSTKRRKHHQQRGKHSHGGKHA